MGEGDGDDGTDDGGHSSSTDTTRSNSEDNNKSDEEEGQSEIGTTGSRGLDGECPLEGGQECETLSREIPALQVMNKNKEISIQFVFYDGMCCACSNS